MKVIICVAKNNGYMFYGKRPSSDPLIIQDISQVIDKETLIVSTYTYYTYPNIGNYGIRFRAYDNISNINHNLNDSWIFIEDFPIPRNVNMFVIYRWNVDYPANIFFNIHEYGNLKRISSRNFRSRVHKKIIREIYITE